MDITTDSEVKLSLEKFLDLAVLAALSGQHQLAVWKKPQETTLNILIDTTGKIKRVPLDLEELPSGFVLHPFADQPDQKAYFLAASEYIQVGLDEVEVAAEQLPLTVKAHAEGNDSKSQIRRLLKSQASTIHTVDTIKSTSKEEFISYVNKGINAIQAGQLSKIVPVKRKVVALAEDFDLTKTILDLCRSYPNAFVNFFHIPTLGSWIGASPEILIKTRGNQFSTMALAGSQKAIGDNPLKNVAWTQKEIEEQALVGRYIVGCFKKIRLREYEEIGPKTDIAGNLLHLRTDFKVDMVATGFPQLGSVMLNLLHPTSAVAGMPREEALAFIRDNEGFDRSLFSGYLGPINIEEETAIFVNLRCAKLIADHAVLYAGAGVTEDSIPEKEWEETELKCDIIGKFIQEQ
ncbi:MAG TPA: chorismate-binding protein [Cyclobacteriaceae bacterium]|nr:chorismate-binding protein [Cyclobacteriaceae bacterium]